MNSRAHAILSLSMRDVVRYLLWAFVFVQPWDTIALPGVGALSRLVGIATFGAALLTTVAEGRIRKPSAIFWFAALMVAYAELSVLWSISIGESTQRVWTLAQLLGGVWIVQQFVRTREEHQALLVAFCLGAFVPLVSLVDNFRHGVTISAFAERYTSDGVLRINADNLGLILVIAFPMAWYIMQCRRGAARGLALLYVALAPVAIVLTGTRTAFLAGLVALSIVRLRAHGQSTRSVLRGVVMLSVLAVITILVVPQGIWARISTIQSEVLDSGELSGRVAIWSAGAQVYWDHPFLGVGPGAFATAIRPIIGQQIDAHNMVLEVLVEQGIVGFAIFMALMATCALAVWRLPPPERKLWVAVMLAWLVGGMSVNIGSSKFTWLLFGMLSAHAVAATARRQIMDAQSGFADARNRVGALAQAEGLTARSL